MGQVVHVRWPMWNTVSQHLTSTLLVCYNPEEGERQEKGDIFVNIPEYVFLKIRL